jgi:YD repeat-containing protein
MYLAIICLLFFISPFSSLSETIIYKYDDLNRLFRVEQPDGSVIKYDYDEVGNRILKEVTPRTSCPGDLKGDGDIDGDDLTVLLTDFINGCSGDCHGDVDANGVVDDADIRMFTEYFGRLDCK